MTTNYTAVLTAVKERLLKNNLTATPILIEPANISDEELNKVEIEGREMGLYVDINVFPDPGDKYLVCGAYLL